MVVSMLTSAWYDYDASVQRGCLHFNVQYALLVLVVMCCELYDA